MEATNAINKETKIPQSLLFDTSNQISEYYTKQFGLITDFYKKFFDISIKGSNDLTNHSFSSNGLFSLGCLIHSNGHLNSQLTIYQDIFNQYSIV
jgi:hypothetical protein